MQDRLGNTKRFDHKFPNYLFSKEMFNLEGYEKFLGEIKSDLHLSKQLKMPETCTRKIIFSGIDSGKP